MGLRTSRKAIIAMALALPLGTYAQDQLSYRYVDVALFPSVEIDAGDSDIDGDGLQLRGSLPVYENFFAFAELQDLDLDDDVDVQRLLIGAGGHWPINQKFDIVGRVGLTQYEVDRGSFDDDDTGLLIGATVRTFVAPRVEVEAGVEYVQVEVAGLDDDMYLVGEGRYHFTPQLSAGVMLTVAGDVNFLGVQGRFNF